MPIIIIEDEGRKFRIQPEDIDASKHLCSAFDNMETEISAGWIIRFLQERGTGWRPFTYEEINAFYSRKHQDGFCFNRLVESEMVPPNLARAFAGFFEPRVPVGGGWIIVSADKKYLVTEEFVERCYKSSPAKVRNTK